MNKQPVRKTILDNGVRILTLNMPYFRSVSLGVWVNVGGRDETEAQSGLSHFIEHMIFKGTRKRTAFEIAKEFDAIGGQTNAFTTMEHTCYYAKVLDTHVEAMVDILSDVFINSIFDADEMERERAVIYQEIGMMEDSPEDYIHVLSEQTFWGDHPLGRSILGHRDNIIRFDAQTLKDFFRKFYQPEQIVISAVGNLDHDLLVALLRPAFESVCPGNGVPQRVVPSPLSRIAVHPKDLEQTHICIEAFGASITDERRFALSLLNTILGGNMSSRLFQEIRERRGLAYSVYSYLSSYVDAGLMTTYAGVSPANIQNTIELIHTEMNKLVQSPVDPVELKNAQEFTKGNMYLAIESTDNQMVRLAQSEIHFGRYLPLKEIIERVETVTIEEIQELAQTLFQPNRLAMTMLGPVDNSNFKEAFTTR